MEINICEHWRIRRFDSRNLVIEESVENGTFQGKHKPGRHWVIRGYYSGLRQCLHAVPDKLVMSDDVATLEVFLMMWDAIVARLAKIEAAFRN